jgi:hypothetical protein
MKRSSNRLGSSCGILRRHSLSQRRLRRPKETGQVFGYETVVQHLHDVIFGGPFHIDPDYTKAKAVLFTKDVAETYVPVKITVGYAGQQAVPRPFLLVMDWVKVGEGWKMASDIAIPVPLPPTLKP